MRLYWKTPKWSHLKFHRREFVSVAMTASIIFLLHCLISWEQESGSINLWRIPLTDTDPYNLINAPELLPSSGQHQISKIIHQTWKDENIPRKFIPWIKSWINNHPDWQYWFWTDKSIRIFIAEKYPDFLATYDSYPSGIQKADAMRYFVLYEYGGLYADLDMESIKPIDSLTYKYNCFIAQEPYEHPALDGNFDHLVMNALMGCKPKHPFMKAIIEALPNFSHFWHVLDSTGPHFVTYVYNQYTRLETHLQVPETDNIYLAPPPYFLPTIDPTKYYGFRSKCTYYNTLPELGQKACRALKAYGFKRQPLDYSFTIHHWIHSYFQNNFSLRSPVRISDIVPNVYIYTRRRTIA